MGEKVAPEPVLDNIVSKVEKTPVDPIVQRESDARQSIATTLVWAYLLLLLVSIAVPLALFFAAREAPDWAMLTAIKEISGPAAAGVSSVTGVIGFVLGYYFKSQDRH